MFRVREKYLKPQTPFLIRSKTENKSRKGLSIKTTQPFIDRTHNHVTPKELSMLLRDIIDFHRRLYGINFSKAINELGGGKHE